MFGPVIRHLLDNKLTTIKEIEAVTGRGTSTIYRWMNEESEPHYMDMRLLVRQLNRKARQSLVGLLTSDLPLVIDWMPEEDQTDTEGQVHERGAGYDVLDRSLLALDCLSHALAEGNESLRKQELSSESYAELVRLVDQTIRHLTASKNLLHKYSPMREKKAGGTR